MSIGQRLKQARLEQGLSQRQLCGDTITRNMLSLIENGSAKPSMDTLQYLAARLDKPIGYFLETSATGLERARQAYQEGDYRQALELLTMPLSEEGRLLQVLSLLALAEEAVKQGLLPYARDLLAQAEQVGASCLYYTQDLERRRLLLCCRAYEDSAPFAERLPDLTEELLLRARAAAPEKRLALLAAARGEEAALLRGQTYLAMGQYPEAARCFHAAEVAFPRQTAQGLEVCYREEKDFEKAYFYACRCRDEKN